MHFMSKNSSKFKLTIYKCVDIYTDIVYKTKKKEGNLSTKVVGYYYTMLEACPSHSQHFTYAQKPEQAFIYKSHKHASYKLQINYERDNMCDTNGRQNSVAPVILIVGISFVLQFIT